MLAHKRASMLHSDNLHHPNRTTTSLGDTLTTGLLSHPPLIVVLAPGKPVIFGKSYTIYEGFYGPKQLRVAIKRLRVLGGDDAYTQPVKDKIEGEVRIRSSLTHENILPLYEKVEIMGEFYFIYPWMEHRDLAKFLTARREHFGLPSPGDHLISNEMRVAFSDFNEANTIHGIASGLAHLHTHDIVHGDIKGENILLDPSLKPLISDFGLTKNEAVDVTATSVSSGAPRWTSPELIDSDTPKKTKESDIYAFGMTIVEILTGYVPYHHHVSSFQVYKAIVLFEERPEFKPLSWNGRDFGGLWELAALCWQKNPVDRQNMDNILKRLAPLVYKSVDKQDGEDRGAPPAPRSQIITGEQGNPSSLNINTSPPNSVSKTNENTPVHGRRQLSVSSWDVSIIPPGKPVSFGNCDLFRGLHEPTQTILAMKRPRVTGDANIQAQTVQRRFSREAKIWSRLNHINILPFYGMINLESEAYLVSPWVEQGDLSNFLSTRMYCNQESGFDEASMIHGVASGLAYLHAHNVIHGDLKAANVLLDSPMNPLICDFGLTKDDEFDVTSEATRHSGTARWTCPTVVDGAPRTQKTDIFSFAMTTVEILTRKPPFPLLSTFRVQLAFAQGRRPPSEPLSNNGKDFAPLWKLAALCWEQDPTNRPNAKEIETALASLEHAHSDHRDQKDPNHRNCHSHDSSSNNTPARLGKRRRSLSHETAGLVGGSEERRTNRPRLRSAPSRQLPSSPLSSDSDT
ncbi:hypothetical protein FRB94_007375 [Tulasnella sp. JGI-2019a]|nr:hypothetical protein FRB93_007115 [Tulasnella sp. JGI-2019a]KAG8997905.1 hypothetical protein FRB94_007375 [Tulasnella sp. JGI-2019a]KAG9029109.1 hypothetical protein FRB95_005652 [Tulasnella sp. JGI-2019a]